MVRWSPNKKARLKRPTPTSTDEAQHSTISQPGVVYHYTIVVKNADGTTAAEDHTFNFYPPSCPNENVRQQTQANYLARLPGLRAGLARKRRRHAPLPRRPEYRQATDPSRFTFVGLYSTIPNSGGSPIDGDGDLYVATRTDTGWVTQYVGLPSKEAAVDGGPPMGPPVSAGVVGVGLTGIEGAALAKRMRLTQIPFDRTGLQNNVLDGPRDGHICRLG